MSSTSTTWSTQGNTKAGASSTSTDSLTTGTLIADTIQLASNVIKASDGGTVITLSDIDDVTITGDLTVSGNRITFGNEEWISNDTDELIQMKAYSTDDRLLLGLFSGDIGEDSGILFYEGNSIRWSIQQDASDNTDQSLVWDYGVTEAGTATKMDLDSSGNLEIAGDLTISGGNITNALTCDSTLTVSGNLIITAATNGIIHTNSGTVTQLVNITTGVTINATSGVITMIDTAISADENIEFTVLNSTVQTDSVILLTMQDENTVDNTQLVCATHSIGTGSFKITVANTDSGQASSATAVKIHFLVINNS